MIKCIPLFSGSGGNSTYISCDGEEFLIDAGVSCSALDKALISVGTSLSSIRGIFITHEHIDHIRGLEIICKKYSIPVYINSQSAKYIYCKEVGKGLSDAIKICDAAQTVRTENAKFEIFKTPHDSWGSVCYRVTDISGDTFALATDIGYVTKSIGSALLSARQVVIESNHDIDMLKNGPYPISLQNRILSKGGHLSNEDCARFLPYLAQSGTEKIYLAHLSRENNLPQLALETACLALRGYNNISCEVCPEKII